MATSKPLVVPVYTVWSPSGIKRGTAEEILNEFLETANANRKEKYSLDEYARVLIDSADYHIPKDAWEFVSRQHYSSEFDRALQYWAAMPDGGVRILARKATG